MPEKKYWYEGRFYTESEMKVILYISLINCPRLLKHQGRLEKQFDDLMKKAMKH